VYFAVGWPKLQKKRSDAGIKTVVEMGWDFFECNFFSPQGFYIRVDENKEHWQGAVFGYMD